MPRWLTGPADWKTFWGETISYRSLVWFVVVGALAAKLQGFTIVSRATLGGVDAAMSVGESRPAGGTTVVAITAADVATFFDSRRPVPPEMLMRVVTRLLDHQPAILVVDVFTEGTEYQDDLLPASLDRVVWAQSADTTVGGTLPVLGGNANPRIQSGLAAMLAEDDGVVRRVRLRFTGSPGASLSNSVSTLPLVAIQACRRTGVPTCSHYEDLPDDTTSVALRSYIREPAFITLEDAILTAGTSVLLKDRIVVVGFVDGSDQIPTANGIRPGPEVVANAIETLMDRRGVLRPMPLWLFWVLNLFAALLLAVVHHRFKHVPRMAALINLTAISVAWFGGLAALRWPGYYTNFVPFMVGMWVENLTRDLQSERKSVKKGAATGSSRETAREGDDRS